MLTRIRWCFTREKSFHIAPFWAAAFFMVSFVMMGAVSTSEARAEGPKLWIEHSGGWGGEYVTDGKAKARQGFFGLFHLQDLIKDNPNAQVFLDRQAKAETAAHLTYWLGGVPSLGVFIYGSVNRNTTVQVISAITGLISGVVAAHFVSQARHNMFEAINEVNGVPRAADGAREGRMKSALEENSADSAPSFEVSFQF